MNGWDITFDDSAWERQWSDLQPGTTLSAAHFLAVMEAAEDADVEYALELLQQRDILLDISQLPADQFSGEAALRLRREHELCRSGSLWNSLEESDPLLIYYQELQALPVCSDLDALAERYLAGDGNALQDMANALLPQVAQEAAELTGYGVLLLDLIQEGSLGLWQAVSNYAGGDVMQLSGRAIRSSMTRLITLQARQNGVGQKLRQALEDYRSADEQLLAELGRNPTEEELAERLHLNPEETRAVAKMLENARKLHSAVQEPDEEEEKREENMAVEDTAYFQARQRILELLSQLSQQESRLLTLRYGLEGGLPLSAEDTAKRLGLTPEEVVLREAAALAKLRNNS